MEVLTVKQLRDAMKGMHGNSVVIIGNDDELNGVHNAWYAQKEVLSKVKLSKHGDYEGKIMEENEPEDEPQYEDEPAIGEDGYEVYLGPKKQKTNRRQVLLIS